MWRFFPPFPLLIFLDLTCYTMKHVNDKSTEVYTELYRM